MNKKLILLLAITIIVFSIFWIERQKPTLPDLGDVDIVREEASKESKNKAGKYARAKELVLPSGFINTEEFKIADLIGEQVILLDIWTYSCINCQRTLPYITAWHEKYQDQGLTIIGIHTPEFEFEKDISNVRQAVNKFDIKYPIVLDNDYGTWRAYNNRYWPRKYLIDIDGYIVYDHIGEGAYAETEKIIQELLSERKDVLGEKGQISQDVFTPENLETSKTKNKSSEVYFGAFRNERLGNGEKKVAGEQFFFRPNSIKRNTLYLQGSWDITEEYARNLNKGDRIIFRYNAKQVFMVASAESNTRMRIYVDGQVVSNLSGEDARQGIVTVNEDRLYKLVNDRSGANEHVLEIEVLDPGLMAFTFTFG